MDVNKPQKYLNINSLLDKNGMMTRLVVFKLNSFIYQCRFLRFGFCNVICRSGLFHFLKCIQKGITRIKTC